MFATGTIITALIARPEYEAPAADEQQPQALRLRPRRIRTFVTRIALSAQR